MPVQFTHPAYLLLLPPALYFVWRLSKASLAGLAGNRAKTSLGLRFAIVAAVILALAGLRLVKSAERLAVVFALDFSDSVRHEQRQAEADYVNRALKKLPSGDLVGVVVFGDDAVIERMPERLRKLGKIQSVPGSAGTDISRAIAVALAAAPNGCARRIILLTDGNETTGSAADQAALARNSGAVVDVVPLAKRIASEALLDEMSLPARVKLGEPFELRIVATSLNPASGVVKIFRNRALVDQRAVALSPGKNRLTFRQTVEKPGVWAYEALLDTEDDTFPQNNRAMGAVEVRGRPRILYVTRKPGSGRYLADALAAQNVTVEERSPAGFPTDLPAMESYDAVVLSDVPAYNLSPAQMSLAQCAVRDAGMGFAMIGGENSFGAGGYFRTPIEDTLPVLMTLKSKRQLPSAAILVIVDKSGSMGEVQDGKEKIRLAAEAAITIVELLQPTDSLGLIACDTEPEVLAPIRRVSAGAALINDISSLRAGGGGIVCYPSLAAANDLFSKVDARVKHVIMLADGSDCEQQAGCHALAAQMRKRGITTTAVAIGRGPDERFLYGVAKAGGGEFYITELARDLPRIFARDAQVFAQKLIVEEPFVPRVAYRSEMTEGINMKTMPPLLGYVGTSEKPRATVPLRTHKDTPLLAAWQYGLGRSVAFTSDDQARWSAHWVSWPEFGKFWAQSLRWAMKRSTARDWQIQVYSDRGVGRVVVDALDAKGSYLNFLKLGAHVTTPGMESRSLRLRQSAPGRYETEFPLRESGIYGVTISEGKKGAESVQNASLVISYPPEFKQVQPDRALAERIARAGGGRLSPPPDGIFKHDVRGQANPTDVWQLLILIAALLLPFDVAVRRLMVEPAQILAAMVWLGREARVRIPHRRARLVERVESVGTLLEARRAREVGKKEEPVKVEVPRATPPPVPEPPQTAKSSEAETEDTLSHLLSSRKKRGEERETSNE